jgi:hypothetical protein
MNNLKVQTARDPAEFRYLASAMRKNSMRQHQFATLLRLLSSRFDPKSNEQRMLRLASNIARSKEAKLRQLLVNLGWDAPERRPRTFRFLIWFKLTKWVPVPGAILLLTLIIAKPVRGRLLDPFYPWKSNQHVKGWTPSSTTRH